MIYFSDCLHNIRHHHNSFCVHPLSFIVVELEWANMKACKTSLNLISSACMFILYIVYMLFALAMS